MKKAAGFNSCLQPMPKIIVSCRGKNGKDNALAVAYCCNCSFDPPMIMVGIVPSRYSYGLIKESGCFVVNLVSRENSDMFHYMGSHSGRDENKMAAVSVKEAVKINAPLLDACPVNIECSVVDSIKTGSHEMFVGKVEYVHAESGLVDETGNIDFGSVPFL